MTFLREMAFSQASLNRPLKWLLHTWVPSIDGTPVSSAILVIQKVSNWVADMHMFCVGAHNIVVFCKLDCIGFEIRTMVIKE